MNEPICKHIEVRCGLVHAFETFTAAVNLWWPPGHRRHAQSVLTFEGHVGGRFFETAPTGEEIVHGLVLAWEPPTRLSYSWFPGAEVGPTTVEIEFQSVDADTTRVAIIHSEGTSELGEAWPERAQRFDRAWDAVLPAFAARLAERR